VQVRKIPVASLHCFCRSWCRRTQVTWQGWYSSHPAVPAILIVVVLNGDMVGRNNSDSSACLLTKIY